MAAAKEQASPSTETPHNIKSSQQPVVLNNSVNIVPEDVQITFNQLDIGRLLGQGKLCKTKVYQRLQYMEPRLFVSAA